MSQEKIYRHSVDIYNQKKINETLSEEAQIK